eukprot:2042497-Ditylum_brightwellii.AAC.1
MLHCSEELVDVYTSNFLTCKWDLEWNQVYLIPQEIQDAFILHLVPEFTTLHNSMLSLLLGWDTNGMKILTTKAREYMATVKSNQERNKIQCEISKKESEAKSTNKKEKPTIPAPGRGGSERGGGGGRSPLEP